MQTEILEFRQGEFIISTDPARLDLAAIHDYLSNYSYWVPGIPFSQVELAAEHSLNFGMYYQGRQIGYARVLTDYARFVYLMDVFVLEDFRGPRAGKVVNRMHYGTSGAAECAPLDACHLGCA